MRPGPSSFLTLDNTGLNAILNTVMTEVQTLRIKEVDTEIVRIRLQLNLSITD